MSGKGKKDWLEMLYPLKFHPRFLEKIWGGRKLEAALDKRLPAGKAIGESWELYDFPPGVIDGSGAWVSSEIANGPLAGRSLHSVMVEFGGAVHGEVKLLEGGQFPILIKYLDAQENLSVQVHPGLRYAREHRGSHLKTEAWYVVESEAGAKLYKGLKRGVTREEFERGIAAGGVEQLINAVAVKAGQCHYLPSGTIHALGAGILVAEVQTPSDTTFRVFDFNRVDPGTGKARPLHIQEALECIDFEGVEEAAGARSHVANVFTTVTRLVRSPFFTIEKVRFSEGVEQAVPYEEAVVWMMLEGRVEVKVDGLGEAVSIGKGETALLPAEMRNPTIKTVADCVWLEVTFPGVVAGSQLPVASC